MRALLSLLLSVGLLTTVCTGGVFALGKDAVDHIVFVEEEVGPMSYGSIGFLSCKSSTQVEETAGNVDVGGCDNTQECISQLGSITHDEHLIVDSSVASELSHPVEHNFAEGEVQRPAFILARVGPLYEDSIMLSHTLLKRE